jgi:hypothetical protein
LGVITSFASGQNACVISRWSIPSLFKPADVSIPAIFARHLVSGNYQGASVHCPLKLASSPALTLVPYFARISIYISMQNSYKVVTVLLLLFVAAVSCSEEEQACSTDEHAVQKPINPNGDSELALLMRAMFEEAQQIKQQIANEEPIRISLNHEEILTAHATDPKKAASAEYKAYANLYLQAMANLQTANSTQVVDFYDNMVANCIILNFTIETTIN